MFKPKWEFDFKVSIINHIVNLEPGKQISIPVKLDLIRGKPQPVQLDVNTNWESVGLSAQIIPPELDPNQPWQATMMIRAALTTPPNSYLFTVRGSTKGTFNTSEDAVTVIVSKNAEQKQDEKDYFQQKQSGGMGESNFSLDKLFVPNEQQSTNIKKGAWGKYSDAEKEKIERQSRVGSVIGVFIGIIILAFTVVPEILKNIKNTSQKGGNCPPLDCGERGLGGAFPKQCPCPPGCPYESYTSSQGFKQCSSFPPK